MPAQTACRSLPEGSARYIAINSLHHHRFDTDTRFADFVREVNQREKQDLAHTCFGSMMCINRSVVLVAVLTLAHGVSAVTFSQTAATSAFSVRKYINTVRLNDGKLVVYGGFSTSGADAHQQVYSSTDDGATWTQEAATVAAGDRYGNPLVLVNGNKIVTAGGSACT